VYNNREVISMCMIRKNITLPEDDYKTIKDFSQKLGISFSEFLRTNALNAIKKSESLDLLEFLDTHCSFVSEEEQIDLNTVLLDNHIDLNSSKGKQLSLDELL
jgi:predicted CopG family antitoxin